MSVRFSGETEAFSSDASDVAGIGRNEGSPSGSFASSTSFSTCDTIAGLGPVLRRRGFEIGELRTPGLALLAFAALFFLAFLDRSKFGVTMAVGGPSKSISTGELFDCVL